MRAVAPTNHCAFGSAETAKPPSTLTSTAGHALLLTTLPETLGAMLPASNGWEKLRVMVLPVRASAPGGYSTGGRGAPTVEVLRAGTADVDVAQVDEAAC